MENWASIYGEYRKRGNQIIFKGDTVDYVGKPGAAIGNYIYSERFSGGTISAKMKFKKISDVSSCEIILFRDSKTGALITAGLGSGPMYAIRNFVQKWEWLSAAGDRKNLEANKYYEVKVSVQGSRVGLEVDGVEVVSTSLPFSTPQTQVGIWCQDYSDILF